MRDRQIVPFSLSLIEISTRGSNSSEEVEWFSRIKNYDDLSDLEEFRFEKFF